MDLHTGVRRLSFRSNNSHGTLALAEETAAVATLSAQAHVEAGVQRQNAAHLSALWDRPRANQIREGKVFCRTHTAPFKQTPPVDPSNKLAGPPPPPPPASGF
eukprot:GHVT01001985.1.p1 GENE.GHVT01001985.1~~GHVT01001985.1.p1  ORF type:complete len:103 (-),score=22.15 GHVT01001985.1:1646-1954(-)